MTHKVHFENGRPTSEPEVVKCDGCGKPHHPSLECPRCDG